MPPQQSDGLLDLFNEGFGLGAHDTNSFRKTDSATGHYGLSYRRAGKV